MAFSPYVPQIFLAASAAVERRSNSPSRHSADSALPNMNFLFVHLIIELSQTNATYLNQRAPQATSYFSQQHNIYLPLNSTSNAAFCSQCGAPTQDSTANFCRSCGNALKKY
ncbi:unnamed protein product [Rotaria socialis]|uniref:Zinc-ribbon domain-containing protein n=1 Tax=Rotaria socialis TaxID=392032 RepID=A0A817XRG5_9BILA|nr:unnamed protein product [Rotaria socialis]CAF4247407.1 unnamed protein product [Rotaria socialis]CAF4430509.1 unnamed protein product [Rotaria socialis]